MRVTIEGVSERGEKRERRELVCSLHTHVHVGLFTPASQVGRTYYVHVLSQKKARWSLSILQNSIHCSITCTCISLLWTLLHSTYGHAIDTEQQDNTTCTCLQGENFVLI